MQIARSRGVAHSVQLHREEEVAEVQEPPAQPKLSDLEKELPDAAHQLLLLLQS